MNDQPASVPVEPVATQDPMAPPAPAPSATPVAPNQMAGAPKKSNSGLIVLLIAVGVIALVAIIGLIVYFSMFYISKADYQKSATQTSSVIAAYNKASTAADDYLAVVEDSTATDTEITAKKTAYQDAYSTYLSNVKTLANERAMKNTKVKAAYDKFATKNEAFTQNNATMVPTMTTLHKIAVNCSESKIGTMDTNDLSKLVSAYDAAVSPCVDSMKELSGSKNTDAAKVGTKATAYFADMRTHIVNMQAAYSANDRTKFESEYNAFMDKANSFSSDTDMTAIDEHQNSLSPTAELNNLMTVINAQA